VNTIQSSTLTYAQIFNDCTLGFIVADTSQRIVALNVRAETLLGHSTGPIIGKFLADVLPDVYPVIQEYIARGTHEKGEHIITKDARVVVHIAAVGTAPHITGHLITILDKKEFKEALHNQQLSTNNNRQLNAILNSSTDGIWVCDGNGTILAINKASEEFNGISAKDFIGKQSTYAAELGLFDRSVTIEAINSKQPVTIAQHVKKKKRRLMVSGTPILDDKGNVSLVIVTERDMTQLNAISDKLEQTLMVTEKYKDQLTELRMQELAGQDIIVESTPMKHTMRIAMKLAHLNASNILILGESGTGKGLLSRLIHKSSNRSTKQFIQINCAALPENLLEAELFGYEKGAFTGAREQGKVGLFELAHGGTLFLDEIGDLPLPLQAKLLKYLDDNEIIRLGGTKPRRIDCSIIAATNRDLEALAAAKHFREDLFFRLNTFVLNIPPLRNRPEDIFELTRHFLAKFNAAYEQNKRITSRTLKILNNYHFPGNIRELENLLKQAVVMSEDEILDDFIRESFRYGKGKTIKAGRKDASAMNLNDYLFEQEEELLKAALKKCRSTREMAHYLGISQSSVVRKMKKHHLTPDTMQ